MRRNVLGAAVLFSAILAAGCPNFGGTKATGPASGPQADAGVRVFGILKAFDLKANKVVLIVEGTQVEHPIAEQVTFFEDPETKNKASALPSDWFGEYIIATLEKRDGKDVLVSLRPPPRSMLPPDPEGTKVSGKFVGWNGKNPPDGKIFLEVDGKKQEYPAAEKMTWYDDLGFKVKRYQDQAFNNVPVTLLLVKQGGREEVVIIRATKK